MSADQSNLDAKMRRLPACTCEVCGYAFDCATRAVLKDVERPKEGDFSLCAKCGEIYVFNEDMTIRIPTIKELMALDPMGSEELTKTQTMIRTKRLLG